MAAPKRQSTKATAQKRRAPNPSRSPLPEVSAFELDDAEILGKPMRLTLSPGKTVLVGRNGAGKSAIFDGIVSSVSDALGGDINSRFAPRGFKCEFRFEGTAYVYGFVSSKLVPRFARAERASSAPEWSERCTSVEDNELLWEVNKGTAHFARSGVDVKLPPGIGLLAIAGDPHIAEPDVARVLRRLFRRVQRVRAGVPRSDARQASLLVRKKGAKTWTGMSPLDRVEALTAALLNWHERDREVFDEFVAVGRRLGVWHDVSVRSGAGGDREIAFVLLDGVDLGMVSDGTLRVAEILRFALSPIARLLLIEEPETSLHPGLLQRVLAELDSYALDHQILLTTHSPLVLRKTLPSEVRLVLREHRVSSVHELTANQLQRVDDFLCDEGHLGDFVFGGGIDD